MRIMDNKEKCNCEALIQALSSAMKEDGYSCENEYYIFRSVTAFCKDRYGGAYYPDIGTEFLEVKFTLLRSKEHQNTYRNAIARLNQAFNGNFHWKPDPVVKPYTSSCFDEIVYGYEDYLKHTKKTTNDMRRHVRLAAELLAVAEKQGVVHIEDITPGIVYIAFNETGAKECFRKIKPFFRYAYQHKLISKDLSAYVPSVSRHKPIPTVYTPNEINTALDSIDRTSETGKRDYCVFLLAARYGIRTSDIASLILDNIDYNRNTIHIIQGKTGVPISYPMTGEVAEALNDYINNARPNSSESTVFLSVRPHFRPLSMQGIYRIVSKYLVGSGIDINGRRHGAHALRSSLATQLLSEGISYSEVQQVLGHTSPDAATHYIRVEEEKLRQCALEVPLLGGDVLSYLDGRAAQS